MGILLKMLVGGGPATLRRPEYAALALLALAGAAALAFSVRQIVSRAGLTGEVATIIGFAVGSIVLYPLFSSIGRIGGRDVRFARFALAVGVATAVYSLVSFAL